MAIDKEIRLVSDGHVFVRHNRSAAINAFLGAFIDNIPTPQGAVRLFSPPLRYPRLKEFDNDDSFYGLIFADPDFIWDSSNQQSGDLRGFATGFEVSVPEDKLITLMFFLQAFSDNAFNARISVYDRDTREKVFDLPPVDLLNGSTVPATGLTENQPPFGWQNIRANFNKFDLPPRIVSFVIVLSFEVQNYVHPNNPPFNPAALAFVADFYTISTPVP